ncbi:MBL fold metallo-hydrolase [Marinigracilibium pacificum]|uniref:MBL fold metallo-hydrolase n=1 Tax=Marinigracilibium pacificum TaxID=2729599 RepID=A0A848IWC6_9BACT|nr:MBL fold metallo-hydrolase [Marinigracilibium pacificum]NMM47468.1 MBL fold metallo-hydrolase [Marinigracilibium pacificum]
MKSTTFILAILLTSTLLFGQNSTQESIKTADGDVEFFPILHATMVLKWNSLTIYVDPYGGKEKFETFPNPDIILITDIHGDHYNEETIKSLNTTNSIFIVPEAVNKKMTDISSKETIIINNGEEKSVMGIKVAAIPMYNLPETSDSRHPKGRGNGYILTIGGKRIYISGDTEDIPEMRTLTNIDVAFVCMNLPYTMTVDQAASAVIEFKPKKVYPFHYRGQGGFADVDKFKMLVENGTNEVTVKLLNWYPE